ncbi:hypothetical protein [Streptomyces purpurascens]|uniref:hypothetical protein n=1 Tax=Streptomyces purpurascens TaxID=1924 RepID=UPI0019C11C71|nr:hypothetical protein GCM10010303_77590 [Streptomyces purpurascens]
MFQPPTRRRVLSLTAGAAATATPLIASGPPAQAAPAGSLAEAAARALPAQPTWAVRPFGLDQVTLGGGVFRAKRDLMLDYARAYPSDRILAVFRANAGLDTRGARPPGGWETADAICAATTAATSSPSSRRRTPTPARPP